MAIVKMKKLRLIGLSSEKNKILDSLQSLSCIEIVKTKDVKNTERRTDETKKETIQSSFAKINFAIDFINEQLQEREKIAKADKKDDDDFSLPKKPLFSVRDEVNKQDFYGITSKEYELFSHIDNLVKINTELMDFKAEKSNLKSLDESLELYKNVKLPLSMFKDTKNVKISIGIIQKAKPEVIKDIQEKTQSEIIVLNEDLSNSLIFTACYKDNSELLDERLSALGFTKCNFNYDITAREKSDEINTKIKEIDDKRTELIKTAVNYNKYMPQFKILYDYYNYLMEKSSVDSEFVKTKLTFVLEGYYPAESESLIKNKLFDITNSVEISFKEIGKKDNPPTLNKNKKLVSTFEGVTDMYSVPNYRESDPNAYMGFFFFLFFGIMLSDAGYGLILTIIGLCLLKFVKMETSTRKFIVLITLGGVSTILWGVLFGGWFGIENIGVLKKLSWINPLEQPIQMLGLCLGVGLIQILFGMGLKAKDMIKHKDIAGAFFDIGSWYMIFAGLGLIALNAVMKNEMLSVIGKYLAILGVAIIILTGGRHEKGFKKITKGLAGLYGIMGYLSDILSYSRLFGLGLATGVVGMVMNKIAVVIIDMLGIFAGIIPAVLILVVGHTFNIAINVLGAYVHNSRLQYIEFFSRFYEGGGRLFRPFGSDLKYINIK